MNPIRILGLEREGFKRLIIEEFCQDPEGETFLHS